MNTLDSLETEYKPKISVTGERVSTFGCAENSTSPVRGQDMIGVKSANQDEALGELHPENIGVARSPVTSFPSKKKKKYKARPNGESAHRRLKGFLLKRLKNPNAIWAKVDFKGFKELTKFCATQVYRAKRWLEEEDEDLVFRTVTKKSGAGWEVLVALKERLLYDEEPLFEHEDGRSRHLRANLLGKEIEGIESFDEEEVMHIQNEKAPIFYKSTDIAPIEGGTIVQQVIKNTEKPNFDFSDSSKDNFHFRDSGAVILSPQASNTAWPKREADAKLCRLAHFLKNQLKYKHWDNCKVKYSPAHAFNYVLLVLCLGMDREDIFVAYDSAQHVRHGDATDTGLNKGNPRLKYEASSTVALVKTKLFREKPKKQQKIPLGEGSSVGGSLPLWNVSAQPQNSLHKKAPAGSRFGELAGSTSGATTGEISEEEREWKYLNMRRFSERDIKFLRRFQGGTLPREVLNMKVKLISHMLMALEERKERYE